ncbi:hypothetical protein ACE6ED_01660 [Paenibacillus sp. CN-4]
MASACGYPDIYQFSKAFKKRNGQSQPNIVESRKRESIFRRSAPDDKKRS